MTDSNVVAGMTLSYWWMHWFWITLQIYCVSSATSELTIENNLTISTEPTVLLFTNRAGKAISVVNPPISNPSNNTTNPSMKIQKLPLKKVDSIYSNITSKIVNSTDINKETTVINQNDVGTIDSQLINDNVTFSAINHTDVENIMYSSNDSGHQNQTFLFSNNTSNNLILVNDNIDEESSNLSAAGITGITLGCVIIVGVICGISYFLYRSRGFNRPQVLNDRCSNPDSSGYIDDASVRDNSEEMYSLDNDSFLNSLEAMTIQNYWTDTVKHTKL